MAYSDPTQRTPFRLSPYLSALGVPLTVDTDGERLVQAVVYLGQVAIGNLHYRFNWYHGPFSPDLHSDLIKLKRADAESDQQALSEISCPSLEEQLDKVRSLMEQPAHVPLPREQWWDLVASWHYLRSVDYPTHKAKTKIAREKPHLAPYFSDLEEVLRSKSPIQ